jgi:endonuclease/exonuclease/phosphatase family metal-dependent hydrolase
MILLVFCCFNCVNPLLIAAQENKIKIMTYNIRLDVASDSLNRWDYRKALLLDQIQGINPDIIGIQEGLPNQVHYLKKGLSKYFKIGLGRDENLTGEASCLYIKIDRFIVKDSGTFWLSETPEKISRGWDAACNRVCTYTHLEDRNTGKRCWIFNTHWDHIGERARDESLRLTLERMKLLNPQNEPMVYMGDFNCTPENKRWESMSAEWIDTFRFKNTNNTMGTFNGFQDKHTATARIDYIWVTRSHFRILDSQIHTEKSNNQWLSDHYPVVSTLVIIP